MSAGRIFVIGSTALVVAAVAVGVYLTGSPQQARIRSLDQERVQALGRLSSAVERYHADQKVMPRSLDELAQAQAGLSPADLRDPETGARYAYRAIGDDAYQLCADFGAASAPDEEVFWRHARGRGCFDFTAPRPPVQPPPLAPLRVPAP